MISFKRMVFRSFLMVSLITPFAFSATLTVKQGGGGDFTTIQAAIDASTDFDIIVVSSGTYNEDINFGALNSQPPTFKNHVTLKAAEGADVKVVAANNKNRVQALGASFGVNDKLGCFINGSGVTIEGITFQQNDTEPNGLEAAPINSAMTIISPDVTISDCTIIGPGGETGGDLLGILLANLDPISLQMGVPNLGTNLTVTNTTFTNSPFGFAINNFLLALGLPAPNPDARLIGCTFQSNGTGIEMDDGEVGAIECTFRANGTGISCSDDNLTINACTFDANTEYGFELETGSIEPDEPAGAPAVTIVDSIFTNNGLNTGSYGIMLRGGTTTVTRCILSNNVSANLYLNPDDQREVTATFDHCDLVNAQESVGIQLTQNPVAVITLNLTNTNVVDYDCIDNMASVVAEINATNCNLFASDAQYLGDDGVLTKTNVLNVDPMYVDAVGGDFHLKVGSPVATAGVGGTYIGALGLQGTGVEDWSLFSF
ncbi:MAG: hypothetical protein GC154_03550 [bacterium]|nr:hypothetical protein [bacterium]